MPFVSSRLLLCSTVASLLLCCLSAAVLIQSSFNANGIMSAHQTERNISSQRHLASASKESNSSISDQSASKESNSSISDQSSDWFDRERWKKIESQLNCFYVENICHGTKTFFYDESSTGDDKEQPLWNIKRSGKNGGYKYNSPGYSIDIGVEKLSLEQKKCFYSPIENHIVLHGSHIGMLGEFYARVLPGLEHMIDTLAPGDDRRKWQEGTQLYLDAWESLPKFRYGPMDKLLDSHHLFLRPFSSNPVLHFRSLQDNTGCSCIKRLFFCGYDKISSYFDENGQALKDYKPGADTIKYKYVDGDVSWAELRDIIRSNIISDDPKIQQLIKETRTEMIKEVVKRVGTSKSNDCKIVGLAQRNGRRKWTNLEAALDHCNGLSADIVCVEVNVEREESNVVNQVATYGALDMLIGIHGAQLTQAILMKDGAVVVELLPFIQKGDYGSWVSRLDEETPLGIIFRGTGLQHVGYPLGNSSLIIDENGSFGDKWAERDFRVDTTIVAEAVKNFLLANDGADSLGGCKKFLERGINFTLYNVHCEGTLKHVYRSHWSKANALCDKDNHSWCPDKDKTQ